MKRYATASEMFANSQGYVSDGPDHCHWCSGKCQRTIAHDDSKPMPGEVWNTTAKLRSNVYMCVGCWLFKRQAKRTAVWLSEGFQDGRVVNQLSWWIEPTRAWAVRPLLDRDALIKKLLKPPLQFSLMLLRDAKVNLIHNGKINDNEQGIRADTELWFTLDNVTMRYTVYELEHAMVEGPEGTEPGVRALCDLLGIKKPAEPEFPIEEEKRGPGRPPALINTARKTIRQVPAMSGK